MNERVFCVDTAKVCEAMGGLYKNEKFLATRPGQTFVMEGHRLKRIVDSAPFLTTAPRDTWPARGKSAGGTSALDYAPATGRRGLTPDELVQLEAGLGELAASLVGGTVFRGLHSLLADAAGPRAMTFAFVLRREGGEPLVYEYVPEACAFAPGKERPREVYLAGLECWASDLLAILRGELGPIALTFGRSRLWNALATRFRFDIFGELYRVSHPLRRPAQTLRTYQALWKKSAGVEPTVRGRST